MLVIGDGDKVTLGTPTVDGAKVVATSNGDGRAAKIIVFRYKPKTRYKRKTGHRQGFTRLTIDRIDGPGTPAAKPARRKAADPDAPVKKPARRKAADPDAPVKKPARGKAAASGTVARKPARRKKKEVDDSGA